LHDEAKIEAAVLPMTKELADINKLKSRAICQLFWPIFTVLASPHIFSFGAGQDSRKATASSPSPSRAVLSLPDRDFYLKDDEKSKSTRDAYVQHVTNMFKVSATTRKSCGEARP